MLSAIAGNELFALFLNIVHDLTAQVADEEDWDEGPSDQTAHYRELRLCLATAVLDGDEELAASFAHRRSAAIAEAIRRRPQRASGPGIRRADG